MKVLVVSPVAGPSSNDRRVLSNVSSVTNAPLVSTDGNFLNRVQYVHLFFRLVNPDASNSCTFYVQLWWWNPITEIWHMGERLKVNNNDIHTIECQGLNRLYLQVDQVVFAGSGTPTLDAWVGMVVPV